MNPEERADVEREIRRRAESGRTGEAVQLTLEAYGPEISRFLHSLVRDREVAREAFACFSENVLKGLPAFRWESTLRTWAYRLARNACHEVRRAPGHREDPVSAPMASAVEQPMRSATHPWQRTNVKARFRTLREGLPVDEQMLLLLRVDRGLSWTEIARVTAEGDAPLGERDLQRRATALRQQLQRIKTRLRALATEEGLLGGEAV